MDKILKRIDNKKQKLDKYPPFLEKDLKNIEEWLRVELTYSSNAIEGNTLTRLETAEVLEKGVAAVISGKSLKDQLEAINHAKAIAFIKNLAQKKKYHWQITESEINNIHKIILSEIDDAWAGRYRETDVFIRGTDLELPSPHKVPHLMSDFLGWLKSQKNEHPVIVASEAHLRLVTIHPYIDGNGRTTRLLMNLVLIINGLPMAVVKPEERIAYLDALYSAQTKNDKKPYLEFTGHIVERSLDFYLNFKEGKPAIAVYKKESFAKKEKIGKDTLSEFLKIGELSKETGETIHTLRYWTKMGLLTVIKYTEGGYQLYQPLMIKRVKEIRKLQDKKRLTLVEIKQELGLKKKEE